MTRETTVGIITTATDADGRALGTMASAANRKTGMSLAELGGFVDRARELGIDPATYIKATAGFRGQLTEIRTRYRA